MAEDFPHFGGVETPVVLPPPSHNGVVVSRKCAKIPRRLAGQVPLGDLLTHPLLGWAARSGQDVKVFVDTAPELGTWSLNSGVTLGTPINNGDGTETVVSRDPVPANGANAPRRFIRLRIVAP